MQTLTPEILLAGAIGLIIGLILGYTLLRFTKGSIKKQAQTESALKMANAQLETQQAQLEKHFSESAELFKTLINDYQKLYRHYANSSNTLLGEQSRKGLFTQQLVTAVGESHPEQAPRDYSEGSSGLLKSQSEQQNS